MNNVLKGLILGLIIGSFIADYGVFYKINCDTKKHGYMWQNRISFEKEGFRCLGTNVDIQREKNLFMWGQLIRNYFVFRNLK